MNLGGKRAAQEGAVVAARDFRVMMRGLGLNYVEDIVLVHLWKLTTWEKVDEGGGDMRNTRRQFDSAAGVLGGAVINYH